jgi:hypothetical protein
MDNVDNVPSSPPSITIGAVNRDTKVETCSPAFIQVPTSTSMSLFQSLLGIPFIFSPIYIYSNWNLLLLRRLKWIPAAYRLPPRHPPPLWARCPLVLQRNARVTEKRRKTAEIGISGQLRHPAKGKKASVTILIRQFTYMSLGVGDM